ncbi:MAG TPA: hypothetical protein VFK13_08385 [Gemmatimonadaceae bacterium]|nr:hypothetical protein [Gemmatimonadaceae bacterium]
MPPEVVAFIVSVVFIVTTGSVVRTWIVRRGVSPKSLTNIEERLTRIEQSIDAMSLEVERISEGQRFTTKLLAERGEHREPVER